MDDTRVAEVGDGICELTTELAGSTSASISTSCSATSRCCSPPACASCSRPWPTLSAPSRRSPSCAASRSVTSKQTSWSPSSTRAPENQGPQGPPRRRCSRVTEMVPVRFAPETLEELRDHAAAHDRSVSAWIRRVVEHELERQGGETGPRRRAASPAGRLVHGHRERRVAEPLAMTFNGTPAFNSNVACMPPWRWCSHPNSAR